MSSAASLVSSILGIAYTVAWSLSFYPQAILHYQRKSTQGLSLEFLYVNVLAFTCYSIYNVGLYSIPSVRQEYQRRNDGYLPEVRLNDVVFAVHGLLSVLVQLYQTRIYPRSTTVSRRWVECIVAAVALTCGAAMLSVGKLLNPLDFLYLLSYCKLVGSFVKYLPQLRLNYSRKSTVGWSIWNIVLDATGGILSIIQLFLDSGLADPDHPFRGVRGNVAKLVLGLISLAFDAAFVFQHLLYRNKTPAEETGEHSEPSESDPLL